LVKLKNCVDEILDFYKDENFQEYHPRNKELWIKNALYLTQLMKSMKKNTKDYLRVKNCLLLLINLCFGINEPDYTYEQGKPSENLENSEKDLFLGVLRAELNNNHLH